MASQPSRLSPGDAAMIPTDPLFDQWHLENTGQLGETVRLDINVVDVWDDYTGAGIGRHLGRGWLPKHP